MDDNKNSQMERAVKDVLAQMEEAGIDCDPIKIEADRDGTLILGGEVCSLKEKEVILQIIEEVLGTEKVVDELVVLEGIKDEEKDQEENESLEDEEEEEDGPLDTEDIYTSIEEGIPYAPPSEPMKIEDPGKIIHKQKKKKEEK
ncbi:MAG: BON domain-containing protein [Candidatus Omnitrophota bacterium]